MPESATTTLTDAARRYLETLADEERLAAQTEVQRFVRWCGADRRLDQLRGQDVANYGDTLTGSVTDASRRAETVKNLLAFAKKAGLTSSNLGSHLRLRKTGGGKAVASRAPKPVEMTETEKEAMEKEVGELKAQRPRIRADISRAMSDKDFRENAPLDAARQQQAYIEGRIQRIEAKLHYAVIIEAGQGSGQAGGSVGIGSTVVLRNLQSNAEITYTVVRPSEADAAKGRISVESPVGQALLDGDAGQEVEVAVPSGRLRFRIERVVD